MLKFLNKKKQDNKGFSLVELIIVVAIMAILVGLLAPQYLKYVEKSRKSADASNLSEAVNAMQVYAADPEKDLPADTYTITINKDADATVVAKNTSNSAAGLSAVTATAADFANLRLKSSKWESDTKGTNSTSISADVEILADGSTKVTYHPASLQRFVKKGTATTAPSNGK